jgi:hypothetical protein
VEEKVCVIAKIIDKREKIFCMEKIEMAKTKRCEERIKDLK